MKKDEIKIYCKFNKTKASNEYIQELDKKLFEEAHEFIEEHSVEELADLMEVIEKIMEIKKYPIMM